MKFIRKNSLIQKLFHISLISVLSITLPICSNASEIGNAAKKEDSNLSEFREIFGLNENDPIESLDYPLNSIRKNLGYRDAGKVGVSDFEAVRPGKNGFVGWVLKRHSDGSMSAGIGTLARDKQTDKCIIYTAKHVVLNVNAQRREEGVEYRFVRPKPNGYGKPVTIELDDGFESYDDIIVSLTPDYEFPNCLEFHEFSEGSFLDVDYHDMKSVFAEEGFVSITPARNGKNPFYAIQNTSNFSHPHLYIGMTVTDLDAYPGMSGSPVLFKNQETNEYELLAVISESKSKDCEKLSSFTCSTTAVMLSRYPLAQRNDTKRK